MRCWPRRMRGCRSLKDVFKGSLAIDRSSLGWHCWAVEDWLRSLLGSAQAPNSSHRDFCWSSLARVTFLYDLQFDALTFLV